MPLLVVPQLPKQEKARLTTVATRFEFITVCFPPRGYSPLPRLNELKGRIACDGAMIDMRRQQTQLTENIVQNIKLLQTKTRVMASPTTTGM